MESPLDTERSEHFIEQLRDQASKIPNRPPTAGTLFTPSQLIGYGTPTPWWFDNIIRVLDLGLDLEEQHNDMNMLLRSIRTHKMDESVSARRLQSSSGLASTSSLNNNNNNNHNNTGNHSVARSTTSSKQLALLADPTYRARAIDMVRMAAKDIATPMTDIQGFMENLERRERDLSEAYAPAKLDRAATDKFLFETIPKPSVRYSRFARQFRGIVQHLAFGASNNRDSILQDAKAIVSADIDRPILLDDDRYRFAIKDIIRGLVVMASSNYSSLAVVSASAARAAVRPPAADDGRVEHRASCRH